MMHRAALRLVVPIALAIVSFRAATGGFAAPAPVDALTVATYNIRHGRGNDEQVDLSRTASALRALNADVIALQEVDRNVQRSGSIDEPRVLAQQLGMRRAFGAFFPYQGGEYGMAILSRHPIRRTESLRLPDGNEPRVALFAELDLPSGARILVVNVHFDWVSNDTLRYKQVQALAAVLDTVTLPTILLGDFNDVPGSRTVQRWQARFFNVAKPASDHFTYSSLRPEKEIDHIMLAPAAAWEGRAARVVTDTMTSDHRPVVAQVTLRASGAGQGGVPWPQHSLERPMAPRDVAPALAAPVPPPTDAAVLFDGRDLSQWRAVGGAAPRWRLVPGGAMEVERGGGDIETRAAFGDVHLHVEWASPLPAEGTGQDRGNSGVFLMGRYEVQVLDSYESVTYTDGQAGAIYGQFPPRVNVTRPPGEWNSYDIEFRRPRFDAAGSLLAPARMTVRHNGVVVQADVALLGPTSHIDRAPYEAHADALPIKLQDHGSPVRFRNIWVRPLAPLAEPPAARDARDVPALLARAAAEAGARQFRAAIATYTRGLDVEPQNALLLRWRGHRYLSVRDFERANADLTRAAEVDPSIYGIWYHLGVLRFARGDYAGAATAFRRAQPIAPDAGELAGSTDWLWMSLQRAGRAAEATAMLNARPDSLPISNAYTQRLRLYRGEIGPDAVFTPADTADVSIATLSYGVGNWYLVRGDTVSARRWFERAVWSGGWPAFGAIVAETELRRLSPR